MCVYVYVYMCVLVCVSINQSYKCVSVCLCVYLTLQLLSEHGEEDGEVDGAAGLLHHGLKLLILHVQLAHGGQDVAQIILGDDTISVLVDDCECLKNSVVIGQ